MLTAPVIIHGQTTDQDWTNTIRNLPGATGFLQVNGLTIHLPAFQLRTLANTSTCLPSVL